MTSTKTDVLAPSALVAVPFAYAARGIAGRERTERLHVVLDVLRVALPVLDEERRIVVRHGPRTYVLPVVDGRTARACPVDPDHPDAWSPSTVFMDGSEEAAADAIRARVSRQEGVCRLRWRQAPVPIGAMRASWNGSVLPAASIRSVSVDDRESRIADALRATRGMAMVGGRLCRLDDDILLPLVVQPESIGGRAVFVRTPAFHQDVMHSLSIPDKGLDTDGVLDHWLRLDEYETLPKGFLRIGAVPPSTVEGGLAGLKWSCDPTALRAAATAGYAMRQLYVAAHRPSPIVERAVLHAGAASTSYAIGRCDAAEMVAALDDVRFSLETVPDFMVEEVEKQAVHHVRNHDFVDEALTSSRMAEPDETFSPI